MTKITTSNRSPASEALRMLTQARTNYRKLEAKQAQQLIDYREKIARLEAEHKALLSEESK